MCARFSPKGEVNVGSESRRTKLSGSSPSTSNVRSKSGVLVEASSKAYYFVQEYDQSNIQRYQKCYQAPLAFFTYKCIFIIVVKVSVRSKVPEPLFASHRDSRAEKTFMLSLSRSNTPWLLVRRQPSKNTFAAPKSGSSGCTDASFSVNKHVCTYSLLCVRLYSAQTTLNFMRNYNLISLKPHLG